MSPLLRDHVGLIEVANELRLNGAYVRARFRGRNSFYSGLIRIAAWARRGWLAINPLDGARRPIVDSALGPIVFFSSTSNQTNALQAIGLALGSVTLLQVNHRTDGAVDMPLRRAFIVSLAKLPITLVALTAIVLGAGAGQRRDKLRAVLLSLDEMLLAPGYLAAAAAMLRRVRPRVLVMSNDHNTINRCLCLAARQQGIKTVYVQHAPVSDIFPSFTFDAAFLDGEASAAVYRSKAGSADLYLVGSARHDCFNFQGMPKPFPVGGPVVSLAYNKVTDVAQLLRYVDRLSTAGIRVLVRPHPGIKSSDIPAPLRELLDRDDLLLHLQKVNVCISSASGILIDALMAGVYPLQADDLSEIGDYYGYERLKAAISCKLEDMLDVISKLGPETYAELLPGAALFNQAVHTRKKASEVVAKQLRRWADEPSDRMAVNSNPCMVQAAK